MARISGNVAMRGVRGRLGEMYYRFRYGNQEVCRMPAKSTKPRSPAQLAQQQLMAEANIYAKRLKTNPEMQAWYEQMASLMGMTNAYHCAVSHYMTSPRLREVNFKEYTGKTGDRIRFRATAWKSVKSVLVKIMDAKGAVVQSGAAQQADEDWWLYTLSESVANWQTGMVVVEITDDLDHSKSFDVAIPDISTA